MLHAPFSYLQEMTLILPILAAGAFSILVTTWSWRTSGTIDDRQFDRVKMAGLVLVGVALLAQSILSAWANRLITRDLEAVFAGTHSRLEFTGHISSGSGTFITDPEQIQEFKRLLTGAAEYAARRSQPRKPLVFSFPGSAPTFHLAQDSATPDVFWFQVDHPASYGRGPWLIRQFFSPDLSRFLKSQGLDHSNP